jgi:RNA polymerase sigma-70 factor (ECF subfamily)
MARWADDDDLVRAARNGEEGAFAELLRRHRDWVCRLMRAVVQDPEQAEDLTQEAFFRVYRHLGAYSCQGSFVPWLKRIAVNLARNCLRERRRDAVLAERLHAEESRPDPLADPENVLASRLLRQEVRAAIDRLPDDQRRALVLHYFTGLSVPEIARRTCSPEGTVKSRIYYARRRVREDLTSVARLGEERQTLTNERSLNR